jgi:hypothetical protein
MSMTFNRFVADVNKARLNLICDSLSGIAEPDPLDEVLYLCRP